MSIGRATSREIDKLNSLCLSGKKKKKKEHAESDSGLLCTQLK